MEETRSSEGIVDYVLEFLARGKFYGRLVCLLAVRWSLYRLILPFNIARSICTMNRHGDKSNR